MLFSATSSKKMEDLTQLAMRKEPIYVGVEDVVDEATVEGLEQGYVVCPVEKRFLLLFSFLKDKLKEKVMVFFSSCNSVKFHHELLNYMGLPVMCIHVSISLLIYIIYIIYITLFTLFTLFTYLLIYLFTYLHIFYC